MSRRDDSNLMFMSDYCQKNKEAKEIQLPLIGETLFESRKMVLLKQLVNISDDIIVQSNKSKFKFMIQTYTIWMDKRYLPINPESWLLLYWNILLLIAIFLNFLQTPITLFLRSHLNQEKNIIKQSSNSSLYFQLPIIYLLLIDMLFIRSRICYLQKGVLIKRHQALLYNYFKQYFGIDLLSLVILLIYINNVKIYFGAKILFYIKYYSVLGIYDQVQNKLQGFRFITAIYQFLKIICFIVLITNWYAYIYFAIDYYYYLEEGFNYDNGFVWLKGTPSLHFYNLIEDFGILDCYVYSLFWALQTSRSVGYGINTPRNNMEVFFCNFAMLTCIVFFVFFTNGVLKIIDGFRQKRIRKLKQLEVVANLKLNFNISSSLADQLSNYVNLTYFQNEQETQTLMKNILSPKLYQQFILSNKKHLLQINKILIILILNDNDQQTFTKKLTAILKNNYFTKGHLFYQSQNSNKRALYLIQHGKIKIWQSNHRNQHNYRNQQFKYDWQYFGQQYFFFNQKCSRNMQAKCFMIGYYLEYSQFRSVLQFNQSVFEKYHQIIDQSLINRHSTQLFAIECQHCEDFHLSQQCQHFKKWAKIFHKNKLKQLKNNQQMERKFYFRNRLRQNKIKKLRIYQNVFDVINNSVNYYPYFNI